MGVAFSCGDKARHGSPRHVSGRLDEHLQVEPIGEPPLNLADRIPRKSEHGRGFVKRNSAHKISPQVAGLLCLSGGGSACDRCHPGAGLIC